MKKKGFTLIELLAVIVILAVIALIATPMVLDTINKSKKGAASSSAYTYVSEVETTLVKYMLKNGGTSYSAGKHTVAELQTDLGVEVKGDTPSEGNICIGSDRTVTSASIKINGYVVSYDGKNATTTNLDEVEDITCDENAAPETPEAALVPTYFEFRTPTTSSTTDYTTLGKNVFATLYSDGTTGGVCINDGGLFCLQTNDYDNSVAAIKDHFGESSCTDYGSSVDCNSSAFGCFAYSDGNVSCIANSPYELCIANGDGSFACY